MSDVSFSLHLEVHEAQSPLTKKDSMSLLKNDIEWTKYCRDNIMMAFWISPEKSQNTTIQNFLFGLTDGLLELPAIVELYYKNQEFRDQLHIALRQVSVKDLVNAIIELWDNITNGDAYARWKSGIKILFLSTGLFALLRQFWYIATKTMGKLSIKKSTIASITTWVHSVGYATDSYTKNKFRNE